MPKEFFIVHTLLSKSLLLRFARLLDKILPLERKSKLFLTRLSEIFVPLRHETGIDSDAHSE